MNLQQIQQHHDKLQQKLIDDVNQLCEKRAKQLIAKLTNFTFKKIIMGMGTYAFRGNDFVVLYDDNSISTKKLYDIIDWLDSNITMWQPQTMTTIEFFALQELNELCKWWVDTTGGFDVDLSDTNQKE